MISSESKQFRSTPLSAFETREIEWIWAHRIPLGSVTLLEGDGGVGKSSIVSAIGSAISSGLALPDDIPKPPKGVLLLAAEDDPSVVLRPRFEANGANLDLVRCYDQAMLLDKNGLDLIGKEIVKHAIGLVVIDPIVSFLGRNLDSSKASDVRSVMTPLHEMATENNCAIVLVRHWNKNNHASAAQKGSGSVDFRNAARSVLQVIKDSENNYLTLEKSNYGVTGKTLLFKLDKKEVRWTGTSNLLADDILRNRTFNSEECRSELAEAKEFLKIELENGPRASADIIELAQELGISKATLKRARTSLGAKARKFPGRNSYFLAMPGQELRALDVAHVVHGGQNEPHDPHPQ